ncbi:MAG TPA: hypothetical protein VHB48_07750 [Chitinophagaceae bacterium]|nr:hypothetical protein [Chitinophagaceae bacterium]
MMLKNFEIDFHQNIGFNFNGIKIDLHNDYNFESFNYNVALRQLAVQWQISNGDWVRKSLPTTLQLIFYNVSYLQIVKKEVDDYRHDDTTLERIGYATADMRNDFDSVIIGQTSTDDDIIIFFLNDQSIRINAESVELIVTER